ncbi:cyclodeaminase [Ureibacillus chungkukjangi]|uniref:Ornithine cyclodeaminase n=1 Tax=Ureibacillus chungkukjangi TaxID=1202712 RepID=A0A318TJI3_9BACL|nr:cyclodeaminase [Ureibacillus chungkukjangi]PYF03960.1 ornithine cyclodeaminase [Ureibacillus chungkukjangi]
MNLFKEEEIRKYVAVNEKAIEIVEEGFMALANGKVTLPPIMRIDIPENNGEIDVKTAYIKGLDTFAIKISSGFFNNSSLGLPSLSGMMILFNTTTGKTESILLDNGYLTDVRTAAAGAVSAKYLAKDNIQHVGVIGTGTQARYQIEALSKVREFDTIHIFGRNEEAAKKYAVEMEAKLGKKVIIAKSPEQVVKESEIVVTTTPSTTPLIQAEWLHPGLHITAIGSDAEHKQELDEKIFSQVDMIVCDVKSQVFRLGELHHAKKQNIIQDDSTIIELGEITAGFKKGRENDGQITVCDLTGTGVQDTVIARFAYEQLHTKIKEFQL